MSDFEEIPSEQEAYENKIFKRMLVASAVGLTALQTYPLGDVAATLGYGCVNAWSAYVLHIGYRFGGKFAEMMTTDNPWESKTGGASHVLAGSGANLPRVRSRHIGQIVGISLAALVVKTCNGPHPYEKADEGYLKRQQKIEDMRIMQNGLKENADSLFTGRIPTIHSKAYGYDKLDAK